MVEIRRLQAKREFVMPANAGIQVRFRFKFKNRLDSRFRRKVRVDFQSTNSEPFGWESRVFSCQIFADEDEFERR
jgi:hypothetical protein